MSREKQDLFLAALNSTKQSHVTNYILRNDGRSPECETDNWPLYASIHWERIYQNWTQLIELIDSNNGFLEELFSLQCISSQQEQLLYSLPTDYERNGLLLQNLKKGSVRYYNKFIDCLHRTKQHHVVSLLEPYIAEIIRPLNQQQISRIQTKHSALIQLMDVKTSNLLDKLVSVGCLTWRHKEFIDSAATQSESNRRLLNIIRRGSQADFIQFNQCLAITGQQHVASLLTTDGVVAEVIAKTVGREKDEKLTIERFMNLLKGTTADMREELCSKVIELVHELREGTELMAMQTCYSIKLFVVCNTLKGLLHLHLMYSNGQLKAVVQQIFNALLDDTQLVEVDNFLWSTSNYNSCVEYLSAAMDLSIYAQLHRQARSIQNVASESSNISSIFTNNCPHELIEIILLKAAGQLFAVISKLTTRADVCTLTALYSVSNYWWKTFSCRPSNMKQLQRYFTRLCYPCRPNPRKYTSFRAAYRHVVGMTELGKKLFVVSSGSTVIQVYSVGVTYSKLSEYIRLKDGVALSDIVGCPVSHSVYISDRYTHCIWRITLSPTTVVEKFITTEYSPLNLSVQSSRVLVTPYTGDKLYGYSSDGQLIKHIQLPRRMLAHHAVETLRETLIVSHKATFIDDTRQNHLTVSELTADGQVLHVFNSSIHSTLPGYLTLDALGNVLVADLKNNSVLHMSSELKLQQVLLTNSTQETGQPSHLCYSPYSGRLYVSNNNSIDVYEVTSPEILVNRVADVVHTDC